MQKQIPARPFVKMIKELKEGRKDSQEMVNEFNQQLAQAISRQNVLAHEIHETNSRINHLRHLIEMYSVIDGHKIFDLWKLETACKITKKDYLNWKSDFENTKHGWKFKT